jgi:hypothetical protein
VCRFFLFFPPQTKENLNKIFFEKEFGDFLFFKTKRPKKGTWAPD